MKSLILIPLLASILSTPPTICVSNPAPSTALVQWSGLPFTPGPSILITCGGVHSCGEILVPSTGSFEQYPISGLHRWKVCVPGPTQDICTPWSAWDDIQ